MKEYRFRHTILYFYSTLLLHSLIDRKLTLAPGHSTKCRIQEVRRRGSCREADGARQTRDLGVLCHSGGGQGNRKKVKNLVFFFFFLLPLPSFFFTFPAPFCFVFPECQEQSLQQ